jgi:hypothetical protein
MQAFECTGQWWLPNDEGHHAAGTLKVSQSGDLRLWLVGALGQVVTFQSKSHPVILGWVDKSPFGDVVTLHGCVLGGSTVGSGSSTRENYHAARAYFGAHLTQKADFAFNSMLLRLGGLAEWAQVHSGFEQGMLQGGDQDARSALLWYRHKAPLVAEVPGGRLTLGAGLAMHQSAREYQFREPVGLSVYCPDAKSADEMNGDYVYPLQNLMTFVCDRPQEVEVFAVRRGEFPANAAAPDIHVLGPRVQPDDDEVPADPVRSFQMLFTLEDVDFGDFIGRWLRVTGKYGAACNVFFGLQYGPPAFIDMTFPGIVQSLYLYYSNRDDGVAARAEAERRLRGILSGLQTADADWVVDRLEVSPATPLQFVLRKLVEEHPHVMNRLVSDRQERFVGGVINTFKYILLSESDLDAAASHGAQLYWMMQKLRFLFKACLLRELGFSVEKVAALFERDGLYQHVCQIEAAEESQRRHAPC